MEQDLAYMAAGLVQRARLPLRLARKQLEMPQDGHCYYQGRNGTKTSGSSQEKWIDTVAHGYTLHLDLEMRVIFLAIKDEN